MSDSATLSLFDSLGQVPDPRMERTRLHQLVDILVIDLRRVCPTNGIAFDKDCQPVIVQLQFTVTSV